jgi:3-oxoacyl-[acyl-carrier protein] reductase
MKKALVLAGTRGIGAGIADSLSELDCEVLRFSSKEVDTGNLEHITNLVDQHPSTDILVLNTGGPPAIDFFDIDLDTWDKYYRQLFLGFCVLLQNIKINNGGYVFLVSSFNIKEPNPALVLSNSYRIAFVSVMKSLSKMLADRKVSFINIAPGPIKTDRLANLVNDVDCFEKTLPMGYVATADEVGRFAKALVENDINYLSGVTINFDGAASNYVL